MGGSGKRKERDQSACPYHHGLVRSGMILEHPKLLGMKRYGEAVCEQPGSRPRREGHGMDVEAKLTALGLEVPDLQRDYRLSTSGAKYVSHLAVGNLLFLSGTVPLEDGVPYMTGVLGADLSIEEGYEAARYAALTSLTALKYALGDLDRMEQ